MEKASPALQLQQFDHEACPKYEATLEKTDNEETGVENGVE